MRVSVDPDMRMYNLLESYPYTPTSALCEFVDNALQAFLSAQKTHPELKKKKLRILISFNEDKSIPTNNFISIRDYGVGIALNDIERALKPAYQPKSKALSEFGIGMKAAAIWFSRIWKLSSLPYKTDKDFSISFDLDSLLQSGKEDVPVTYPNELQESGVCLTLYSPQKNNVTKKLAETCWHELQEVYQLFTEGDEAVLDLVVEFNKTELPKKKIDSSKFSTAELVYPTVLLKGNTMYSFGDVKAWHQNIDFTFNQHKVHGFLSVLSTSSQQYNPGIRLFRYKRLIQGSVDKPYRPTLLLGTANKHAPSRIYGELHLDGQPISNHKGDFQFDEVFFLETLKNQPGVADIIHQAESYRAKQVETNTVKHYATEEDLRKDLNLNGKSKPSPSSPSGPSPKAKTKKVKSIHFLEEIIFPSDLLLLHGIKEETVALYNEKKWWPFCLCYRVVLELGIFEKIKRESLEKHYPKIQEKAIEALIRYIAANSKEFSSIRKYKTLTRQLKDGGKILEELPCISLLNLASHGNWQPTQGDVDPMLTNTQELLQWIAEK